MFGRKTQSEPPEWRAMRKGFRQADRRMAVHDALAPFQPSKIDPSTGRTNREMRAIRRDKDK